MKAEIITYNSWITPKIEIRKTPDRGRGMFAIKSIHTDEKVLIFGGKYSNELGAQEAQKEGKLIMQWDENLYSIEDRGDDSTYFINHSCDPNLWMSDAFTLISRRNIEPGEEVTADYAVWEAEEEFVSAWECECGSPLCRNKITGNDWNSPELQQRYKGHFSPLLNKRIEELT